MPLAVLVAGDLVSGRRPQPPAPSVTLNPIRTRWMEHLGRRPPCLRIMPFRTSCGRPDPAAGAVCGGHDRVCPALSGTRHCRKSRSLAMCMVSLLSLAITVQGQAIRYGRGQPLEIQNQPVAPSPTRIACPGSAPRQPTVCHRTTRCPLLCASHDKRESVVRRQG